MDDLRFKVSLMLGAENPNSISIGQNMTTLNYSLARALSRKFKDGDTITIEPFRANAFPVVKDLAVDRSAFARIQNAGGFVSVNTSFVTSPLSFLQWMGAVLLVSLD